MDRPEAIFDHADLGTREPGDPALRGYDPGHPWYYLLGGRPLRPEETKPDREWELPHDVKLDRMKDPAKRRKRLLEMQKEYEEGVKRDIERYLEVLDEVNKVSELDKRQGYGLETSIYLCHNHIWASKAWLTAINRELEKLSPPPTPRPIVTASREQVEKIIVRWYSKPEPATRGGICYHGKSQGKKITIMVKDGHWDTPPTTKLIQDLRKTGWKMEINDQADLAGVIINQRASIVLYPAEGEEAPCLLKIRKGEQENEIDTVHVKASIPVREILKPIPQPKEQLKLGGGSSWAQ